MRSETEPRPRRAHRPPPDLDAEQEVDLSGYWRTLGARWWILVAAVVAGALVGYFVSLGSGTTYRAKATIYLGQPLSPSGIGGQIQSLGSNPSTAGQIAKAESTIQQVASTLDLPPGKLRRGVSTGTVGGALVKQGQTPLVTVSVRGPWRDKTAQAANMIAGIVVTEVSGYVDGKITALKDQQQAQTQELESLGRRIEQLETALASGNGLSGAERLALVSVLGLAEERRGSLAAEQAQTREALSVAENVERSRVITKAAPTKVSARSHKSSLAVGALLGLIVGIAAALLWDPLLERRRPRLS
jgi:capsular polysaccharide biosynthesis protein